MCEIAQGNQGAYLSIPHISQIPHNVSHRILIVDFGKNSLINQEISLHWASWLPVEEILEKHFLAEICLTVKYILHKNLND